MRKSRYDTKFPREHCLEFPGHQTTQASTAPPRKPPARFGPGTGESKLSLSRGRATGTSLRSSPHFVRLRSLRRPGPRRLARLRFGRLAVSLASLAGTRRPLSFTLGMDRTAHPCRMDRTAHPCRMARAARPCRMDRLAHPNTAGESHTPPRPIRSLAPFGRWLANPSEDGPGCSLRCAAGLRLPGSRSSLTGPAHE